MKSVEVTLSRFKEELLDLLYPKSCFNCKKSLPPHWSRYLCPDCTSKIIFNSAPLCRFCGLRLAGPETAECSFCSAQVFSFQRGYTAVLYEGLIKECIHSFKYSEHTYLGNTLAQLMVDFARQFIDCRQLDLIVPVPLHWRKLRDRGFNQAGILARALGRQLQLPVGSILKRIRHIPPQVDLSRGKRLKNVSGAFMVSRQRAVQGKTILLIDDVFTTGATLNECSRVLQQAGAAQVWVYALARG